MSREEQRGSDLFGQNLWMAAKELADGQVWIITGEHGIEYRYTGTEEEARRLAMHLKGKYRKEESNEE